MSLFRATSVKRRWQRHSTAAALLQHYDRLDILVSNAAVSVVKAVHLHTPEEWDAVMNSNVKSLYWSARHVIPVMIKQEWRLNSGQLGLFLGRGRYPDPGCICTFKGRPASDDTPDGDRVCKIPHSSKHGCSAEL